MKTLLISLALFINPIISNESDEIIEYDNISNDSEVHFWQRCISGLYGKDCKQGKAKVMNWYEAVKYCEDLKLGNKKWKLPKFSQLVVFINTDFKYKKAKMDLKKFTKNKNYSLNSLGCYWSLDEDLIDNNYAIYVNFLSGKGFGYTVSKKSKAYVRCVSIGEKKQVEERIEREEDQKEK
jgi:hypothetical protein